MAAAQTPEAKAKRWASNRQRMADMVIAAHSKQSLEKANASRMKIPGFTSCPENFSAKWWSLRDYNGRVHQFKNLSWWISQNKEMFDPDDVRPPITKSRAYGGITKIKPSEKKTKVIGSWKGWTWFSVFERRFNDGKDLLLRTQDHQEPTCQPACNA